MEGPRDLILESNEKVLLATRPLFLWEPLVILDIALFVLSDRRVIARWGVFNRNQSALLLDRIQDASLARPFPLSLIRDYGVLRLESAGEHASERISGGMTGGPQELAMTHASAFYRALTDAQTPN